MPVTGAEPWPRFSLVFRIPAVPVEVGAGESAPPAACTGGLVTLDEPVIGALSPVLQKASLPDGL
jgi:hypothetical protein